MMMDYNDLHVEVFGRMGMVSAACFVVHQKNGWRYNKASIIKW